MKWPQNRHVSPDLMELNAYQLSTYLTSFESLFVNES